MLLYTYRQLLILKILKWTRGKSMERSEVMEGFPVKLPKDPYEQGSPQLVRTSVRFGIEGSRVQDLPEAMCCVHEQDTVSSAKYWFTPGRQESVSAWLKNCWLGHKASIRSKRIPMILSLSNIRIVRRKPVIRVNKQIMLKPACSNTKTSYGKCSKSLNIKK